MSQPTIYPVGPVTIRRKGREFVAVDAFGENIGSGSDAERLGREMERKFLVDIVIQAEGGN